MNWKIFSIITIILVGVVLGWAIYTKIVQPTESQRGQINNFTFEPHQTLGCANYNLPKDFSITSTMPKSIQKTTK